MNGEFLLRLQTERCGHYAHVRVSLSRAPHAGVELDPRMLDWVHDVYGPEAYLDSSHFDDLRNGALFGASYALHRAGAAYLARVLLVRGVPADTSEDDVRFATAFAVWDALGRRPTPEPTLDAATGFRFPHPPSGQGLEGGHTD